MPQPQHDDHLLVIRLSAMGDCAIAVPVLRRFIQAYPNVNVSVITKPFFAPIFNTIPQLNVLTADTKGAHKGFLGIVKLALQLRHHDLSKVADLHNVLRSKIIRTVLRCFGIPGAKIDKGRAEKKALTRPKNKVFAPLKTSAERYADVFAQLGYPIDLNTSVPAQKPSLPSALANTIGHSSQKWIGMAPFAAHASKTYPQELTEKIIARLNADGRYKLLLFGGGKRENELLNSLTERYDQAICMAGKFSFTEELQVVANCDVMLAMDSGNGHLAAMFDVPTITLWGSTHPYVGFAPFGQPEANQFIPDLAQYPLLPTSVFGKTQLPGYEKAMHSISPEQVVNRLSAILTD